MVSKTTNSNKNVNKINIVIHNEKKKSKKKSKKRPNKRSQPSQIITYNSYSTMKPPMFNPPPLPPPQDNHTKNALNYIANSKAETINDLYKDLLPNKNTKKEEYETSQNTFVADEQRKQQLKKEQKISVEAAIKEHQEKKSLNLKKTFDNVFSENQTPMTSTSLNDKTIPVKNIPKVDIPIMEIKTPLTSPVNVDDDDDDLFQTPPASPRNNTFQTPATSPRNTFQTPSPAIPTPDMNTFSRFSETQTPMTETQSSMRKPDETHEPQNLFPRDDISIETQSLPTIPKINLSENHKERIKKKEEKTKKLKEQKHEEELKKKQEEEQRLLKLQMEKKQEEELKRKQEEEQRLLKLQTKKNELKKKEEEWNMKIQKEKEAREELLNKKKEEYRLNNEQIIRNQKAEEERAKKEKVAQALETIKLKKIKANLLKNKEREVIPEPPTELLMIENKKRKIDETNFKDRNSRKLKLLSNA